MASNVAIAGGMLRLTAQREESAWAQYTTGAVETRDKAVFDATATGPFRICMLAQMPGNRGGTGAGYAPTFRLLPKDDSCVPDHGELDIVEQLDGGDNMYATYRTAPAGAPACSNTSASDGGSLALLANWYNEYSVEVDGDGSFVFVWNNDLVYESNATLPLHVVPWFLNLGFGVGAPNASTVFPQFVNVDWIKVVARTSKLIFKPHRLTSIQYAYACRWRHAARSPLCHNSPSSAGPP